MRLYLSAESKKHIGYTPDTLIVENKETRYEYDIQGETDYDMDGLNCRTKGVLCKRNDSTDSYDDLSQDDIDELMNLLRDENTTVIIAVYPCIDSEEKFTNDEIKDDILSNCSGTLMFQTDEVSFDFHTEYYGI